MLLQKLVQDVKEMHLQVLDTVGNINMKRKFLIIFLFLSSYIYSQDWKEQSIQWNRRSGDSEKLIKGFSVGFLIQGQTKYPSPYLGPEIKGKFNDGAYHFIIDLYLKKFILGFQISDEYFFIENVNDDGSIWKPRGFNGSFSSLTRGYWISFGYNIWDKLYIKSSFGFRTGPSNNLLNANKTFENVANGFNFTDTSLFYNSNRTLIQDYSEKDFLLSINYLIQIAGKLNFSPEFGYSYVYGGITFGSALHYKF